MNLDSVIDARVREIVQQELAVLRMAPSSDGWMTRAEVARFWKCSWETAAARLSQPGAPQPERIGKRKMWRRAEVERWK